MDLNKNAEVVFLKPEYCRTAERSNDMTTQLSHKIGLVLHVDDNLGEARRTDIEGTLESEMGVTSAHFTDHRPHLMVVEYDPEVTTSIQILDKIVHQSVHAELVGPI
jgi:hypothetical protein